MTRPQDPALMVESSTENGIQVIRLFPNRSASWEETRLVIIILCATTLAIGVFWTFVGAWMVLPFSGLEAGLVAYLMYRVSQSTYRRQVITLGEREVQVQFGTRVPKRSWTLERERTHLSVIEPEHHLDPIRIRLFDREHSIEIGHFLNKDDKEQTLKHLRQAGLTVRSHDRLNSASF